MTKEQIGDLASMASWLVGWCLLTAWCVVLFGWVSVWCSAGLLLVGVAGIRPLGLFLWHGFHFLPRGDE